MNGSYDDIRRRAIESQVRSDRRRLSARSDDWELALTLALAVVALMALAAVGLDIR